MRPRDKDNLIQNMREMIDKGKLEIVKIEIVPADISPIIREKTEELRLQFLESVAELLKNAEGYCEQQNFQVELCEMAYKEINISKEQRQKADVFINVLHEAHSKATEKFLEIQKTLVDNFIATFKNLVTYEN